MNQPQIAKLNSIASTVITGHLDELSPLISQAIHDHISPRDILEKGLIHGMNEVSKKFKSGEMFIPEVMLASQVMHKGIQLISPQLSPKHLFNKGTIVLGTVQGDIHDIGKTLVRIMLQGGGFKVIDLGINVSASTFISQIQKQKTDILALSALLSNSLLEMKKVMEALQLVHLKKNIKIIIGGAPVTEQFAREIGADAYGEDAGAALIEVRKLMKLNVQE